MATPDATLRRQNLARRLVYVAVAIAVIVPFIKPVGLPLVPNKRAKDLFDRMEKLPKGSPVLLAFDYAPASKAELYPMSVALLDHCFLRGLRPIVMTHWVNGLGMCDELVKDAAKRHGKTSGTDYVFLGFKPGWNNLILNMGESLQRAFARDYYGKPTEAMPALEGVKSLKHIPFVIDLAAGGTIQMWIIYGRDRFGFDLGAGCTAVIAPDLYPFLDSKQLIGLLGGLRGAADYEELLATTYKGIEKPPREATKGMDAQSLTHLLIIALVLGANVRYLVRRLRGKDTD